MLYSEDAWILGFVAVVVLAGVFKVGFWILMALGFWKSFTAPLQQTAANPWAALFGLPQAPAETPAQILARRRSEHLHRYEMWGLSFGMAAMLVGVGLVLLGFGPGDTRLELFGFIKLDRAGPGVIAMVLGLGLIKFTRRDDPP